MDITTKTPAERIVARAIHRAQDDLRKGAIALYVQAFEIELRSQFQLNAFSAGDAERAAKAAFYNAADDVEQITWSVGCLNDALPSPQLKD